MERGGLPRENGDGKRRKPRRKKKQFTPEGKGNDYPERKKSPFPLERGRKKLLGG